MYTWLLPYLICPHCLPQELSLSLEKETKSDDQDIIFGQLRCPKCHTLYPIEQGVALMTRTPEAQREHDTKYEQERVLASYLWSHYADLFVDPLAQPLFPRLGKLLAPGRDMALDCGCAVGRFTFELALKSRYTVGVDLSQAFIRAARHLAKFGHFEAKLPIEGDLVQSQEIRNPRGSDSGAIEFLVADVMALPFCSGAFDSLCSINVVDKVSHPLRHLQELNRMGSYHQAELLLADPFSWSKEWTPQENWLGGREEGLFSGLGQDNVKWLLQGQGGYIEPSWQIGEEDCLWWKLRTHINHYELIRSWVVTACRYPFRGPFPARP
jgi:SAM-dependent methyltransferase